MFKDFIVYLNKEKYTEKYEERLNDKNPNGKKYDEDIGFPYFSNPRDIARKRIPEYFNKMIRSVMHEKDKELQKNLMIELSKQFELLNGYAFRLMEIKKEDLDIPEEYRNLFDKKLTEAIEYLDVYKG